MKNVIMARQVETGLRAPAGAERPQVAVRQVAPIANLRAPIDGPKLRGATGAWTSPIAIV